jgi:ribose-phosphate pyrophosphokinase
VIVDDICDGGRTFTEIAKAIRTQVPNARIYLVVTHGIFSAGFEELEKYFERIYTTNSYKDTIERIVNRFNVFK